MSVIPTLVIRVDVGALIKAPAYINFVFIIKFRLWKRINLKFGFPMKYGT